MPYTVAPEIRSRAYAALEFLWESEVPEGAKQCLEYFLGIDMSFPEADSDCEKSARRAFCEAIYGTPKKEIKGIVARRVFPPSFLSDSREVVFIRPNQEKGTLKVLSQHT